MSGPGGLDASDPAALLAQLGEGAERALGAVGAEGALEVARDRSLGDRLAGRPGRVTALELTGPQGVLALRLDGRRLVGSAAKVVGGVTISRRSVGVGEWVSAFTGQVAALAADAAGDAGAASAALVALGVRSTDAGGADLAVDERDVDTGLALLATRVAGRLPPESTAVAARVVALLRDTLPRVAGAGEAEVLVRRTATAYLPDTLRAYAALPPDWAATHVLADGRTPAQALLAQLEALEAAASAMRDAALESDASAVVVNGLFLRDKFAGSSLDLPG